MIAVFDSGIGGISVVAELARLLPAESFFYFADAKNAPYGDKAAEEIRELMRRNMEIFLEQQAKAVVLACNTATSAAAAALREEYKKIPILGIEPALKPALKQGTKKILIMATALTIKEEKLHKLAAALGGEDRLILLPCSGLMEMIEENPFSEDIESYLQDRIAPYREEISGIVLGCTHYSFIKPQLSRLFPEIALFDGNEGLARHLQEVLAEQGLLTDSANSGEIIWRNSLEDRAENEAYSRHCEEIYQGLIRL